MHQDSTGKPIEVGNTVRWRGQNYTIKDFSEERDPNFNTPMLIFNEPLHLPDEKPYEFSVDLVLEELKDEVTQFFTVILVANERMYACKHKHLTRESADACVSENNGVSIFEWVKDRRPQFDRVWVSPDIDKEAIK